MPDVGEYEVVQKPFDLDELVDRVRHRLGQGDGSGDRPRAIRRSSSGRPGDDGRGDCPGPVELILYVSAKSPRSASAIANIKRVLSRYRDGDVRLTIYDLEKDPAMGLADSIAFTPTLVKRSRGGPRTFILGHINNPQLLIDLLEECEPTN
jgi:hypothetical protein